MTGRRQTAVTAGLLVTGLLVAMATRVPSAHAAGMGGSTPSAAPPAPTGARPPAPATGGFDPSAIDRIVPDRDAPIMFAKSPRSCIIDPGEPFYIVGGRQRTDYEGEMTLYPGDLILTGTPAGTGAERQKFLKDGDVVTIEVEGIGTLTTPFKAK